ncbi:DUF6447 family protein [Polynucleobacter sp. JS-JIR-II-b4]|uniref:DUF6447 family protein n=1 Tax=Polynucleobacter sp. JS-JIR-II-b4 TaxID=1758390 RepID=UPI001BFD6849|nr:DUF6447 family protein [Polynucleobacter sp. JS-JIR-II-b4]QWE02860.1 hypothetical protein ICV90_01855 [Polynucleobacter sp. JS-JIR-II-b4]
MANENVTIDGKEYPLEDLSDVVKQQLASLRATDMEIARTEATLAMLKTARVAYARAAKSELEK